MDRIVSIEVSTHQIDALLLPEERPSGVKRFYKDPAPSLRLAQADDAEVDSFVLVHNTVGSPNGHRGVWFYDPTLYGEIKRGDTVVFKCGGHFLAQGVVMANAEPVTYPKYCSGINSKGFTWEPVITGEL